MVAQKIKIILPARRRMGRSALSVAILAFTVALSFILEPVYAQNLINRGKITNTGTLRVKNQAVGITDTLNGTFEMFGTNQTVPATQFGNLSLTGSGTYIAAGNATVMKNFSIAPAVTLQVPAGDVITLGSQAGQLTENGYLSGKITKAVDLSASSPDTNFGGMGASISWIGTNPGVTSVTRSTGTVVSVSGRQSIRRYFDISPTTSLHLNASLNFTYSTNELAGSDATTLDLWRSPDNGVTWRRQKVTRNGNTLTKTGLQAFGRWTAADANNLLGLTSYEWFPDSLRLIAGNNQTARVKRLLDTAFVATVVDAYGQPTIGQNVLFTVTQRPLNSVGDSLTTTSATSDSLGQIRTFLKLGSLKGDYYVQATVPGVSTAVANFHAIARPAASILNVLPLASSTDSVKSQIGPIAVRAADSTGAAVQGVQVNFAVTSAPDTAGAYQLTNATVNTDTTGTATTVLKLGSKTGSYIVTASSPDVDPPVARQFLINALPGTPAFVTYAGGGNDTVTALKRMSVRILDSYANPRRGDTVQFALTNKPVGSTLDSLLVTTGVADSNGYAVTTLRVGEKAGIYAVSAVLKGRSQFSSTFITTAHGLAASKILATTTAFSDTIGAVLQPFNIALNDKYDNIVAGTAVSFSIAQRPDTSAGGSLSATSVFTDSTLGRASTVFTAGDRVGTYQVLASANGLSQSFVVQVGPGRPAQMLAYGSGQTKMIMLQVDSLLTATLTDRKANPLANLPVTFTIAQKPAGSSGESLSISKALTNAQGIASTRLTLGNKVGLYLVSATSDSLKGVVNTFQITATHSAATALNGVSGLYQTHAILSVLDTAFVVSVTDQGGNPVPGIAVNFAISGRPAGASSDSLTKSADTTNANGLASTYLKLGTKVGDYTVQATSAVLPTVSRLFTAKAVNGAVFALTKVGGERQNKAPYSRLDSAFVVHVRDIGDNPIPGAIVRFRITQIPLPETTGQSLSDTTVVTDSSGSASTVLTLGDQIGVYVVTATVNGLPSVSFTSSAFLLAGDANEDGSVNIGDLTSIIDHIIGKITLSVSDSAAADVNADGVIDIRDAVLMRDRLLTGVWTQRISDSLFALVRPPSGQQSSKISGHIVASVMDTSSQQIITLGNDLEVTENGMRLNLSNNQPVKGLQYIIRMKNPPMIQKPDVIYDRSKMMSVLIFRTDTTLRIVAYNLNNSPIQPGAGSLFRLPIPASRVSDIDTSQSVLIVSQGVQNRAIEMPFMNLKNSVGKYPKTYALEQNYPNPFNNTTIIYYEVPDVAGKLAHVTMQVFNILGEKVKTLVKEDKAPGRYFVVWDGSNDSGQKVASGAYIYRLVWKENQNAKKMLLIK